jgi:hypothetical protein
VTPRAGIALADWRWPPVGGRIDTPAAGLRAAARPSKIININKNVQ